MNIGKGKRKEFTVPLSAEGTAFQKDVWVQLYTIRNGVSAFIFRCCRESWKLQKLYGHMEGKIVGESPNFNICPFRVIGKELKAWLICWWLWEEWLFKPNGILKWRMDGEGLFEMINCGQPCEEGTVKLCKFHGNLGMNKMKVAR